MCVKEEQIKNCKCRYKLQVRIVHSNYVTKFKLKENVMSKLEASEQLCGVYCQIVNWLFTYRV